MLSPLFLCFIHFPIIPYFFFGKKINFIRMRMNSFGEICKRKTISLQYGLIGHVLVISSAK